MAERGREHLGNTEEVNASQLSTAQGKKLWTYEDCVTCRGKAQTRTYTEKQSSLDPCHQHFRHPVEINSFLLTNNEHSFVCMA